MLALLRGVTYTSVALLIVTNKQGVYVLLRSSACATRQPCPCVVVTARRTPVSVRWGQRIVENNRKLCYSLLGSAVSIYSRNRLLLDSRKVYEQPTIFFTLVFRFFFLALFPTAGNGVKHVVLENSIRGLGRHVLVMWFLSAKHKSG